MSVMTTPPQVDVRGNQDQSLFGSLDEADDLVMNCGPWYDLHGGRPAYNEAVHFQTGLCVRGDGHVSC
jgi:hypothetical protein